MSNVIEHRFTILNDNGWSHRVFINANNMVEIQYFEDDQEETKPLRSMTFLKEDIECIIECVKQLLEK